MLLHYSNTFSIVLVLFVFLVLYHGRQVEIDSSLDFLWKQQARKELEEMTEMRRHTNQLLHNILPAHVAKYFLEQDRQSEVRNTFFINPFTLETLCFLSLDCFRSCTPRAGRTPA